MKIPLIKAPAYHSVSAIDTGADYEKNLDPNRQPRQSFEEYLSKYPNAYPNERRVNQKKIFINGKFALEDFKPSLPLNGKLIKTPELIKTVEPIRTPEPVRTPELIKAVQPIRTPEPMRTPKKDWEPLPESVIVKHTTVKKKENEYECVLKCKKVVKAPWGY